jgi:hypothetical protein
VQPVKANAAQSAEYFQIGEDFFSFIVDSGLRTSRTLYSLIAGAICRGQFCAADKIDGKELPRVYVAGFLMHSSCMYAAAGCAVVNGRPDRSGHGPRGAYAVE